MRRSPRNRSTSLKAGNDQHRLMGRKRRGECCGGPDIAMQRPTKRMRALRFSLAITASMVCSASLAQDQNPLLAAAQKRMPTFIQDLDTLVNIDSGTDDAKGLAQVESFLAQRLRDLGAIVEVSPAPPAAGKVLRGTFEGTGTKNIMLMIHYDTVFGVGEAAKRPFRVEANKAFGPGA